MKKASPESRSPDDDYSDGSESDGREELRPISHSRSESKKHRSRNKGRKAVFLLDNLITDQRQYMQQQCIYYYPQQQQTQQLPIIPTQNTIFQDQSVSGQCPACFHAQPKMNLYLESINTNYIPGPFDFLPRGKFNA